MTSKHHFNLYVRNYLDVTIYIQLIFKHIKHVSNVIPNIFIIYLRLPRANQKITAL